MQSNKESYRTAVSYFCPNGTDFISEHKNLPVMVCIKEADFIKQYTIL